MRHPTHPLYVLGFDSYLEDLISKLLCYIHQLLSEGCLIKNSICQLLRKRTSSKCVIPRSSSHPIVMDNSDPERAEALEQYKKKLLESREQEAKLKALRLDIKGLQKEFDTTEDNIKALQSVGQIIGEVLKQLDEERCKAFLLCKCVQSSLANHF